MHCAVTLLWLANGWTKEQRRRYFASIADAVANSRGGHGYREFWGRSAKPPSIKSGKSARRVRGDQATPAALAEGLPSRKVGPRLDRQAVGVMERGLKGRDAQRGREMFAAAGCVLCHQINGKAASSDLDVESALHGARHSRGNVYPSKAMSDQYQMVSLELADGRTLSGRIVSRDEQITRIATDLMRPTESEAVPNGTIRKATAHPVSTMPSGLLNALNEDELLDLVAYLKGGAR
jgi:putative heme-binding domain-containing protein